MSGLADLVVAGSCESNCNSKFGEFIGQSLRTKAYSNCNDSCVSDEPNYILYNKGKAEIYTGMKWQCVEYARRWMIENKGLSFGDVTYAYEIWSVPTIENIHTHQEKTLQKFANKTSKSRPQAGDLLIYDTSIGITGHVAVIIAVGTDYVFIAEQNYFNHRWMKNDHSRELLMKKDDQGQYQIMDKGVIGWVHY